MRVGRTDERLETRIDRRTLDVFGVCRFRALPVRQLSLSTPTDLVGLRTIRVSDMPELQTIDLSACRPGFELHLDAQTAPPEVVLPAAGARVFIEITAGFPSVRIDGRIEELVIRCVARHPVAGLYRIDGCDGAVLMPGDALEPAKDIERYIRIDQSERGLQYKDLRRGVGPSEVMWKLVDAKTGPLAPIGVLARMDPAALARFALDDSKEAVEERRAWLEGIEQPEILVRHLLRQLHDGAPPRAIWALRCLLQCSQRGDERAAVIGHALLSARAIWGTGRSLFRRPRIDVDDLELLLTCRPTGLTRRCDRFLAHRCGAAQLPDLLNFAATLPAHHPWAAELDRMIEVSIDRWHRLQTVPYERLTDMERADRMASFSGTSRDLEHLFRSGRRLRSGRTLDRLTGLVERLLDADERVRLARKLSQDSHSLGRPLVLSALRSGAIRNRALRIWAARFLLGHNDPHREGPGADEDCMDQA
ncbi:hypothetical protein HFP89_08140 [Wenzhouxiangella sp. XN79A]|uniref:hypothetical protein n=1 Tax=Wenzhouxiangella sp. XN79A TaxID=2724193 RepID=UPI00144AE277|nr:hypothetical protein [Wenzhouxiangella sp. XN79A]NKI35134.1 hypothetical protein [Wenzhouxiangella sp. XN79A]